MGIDIIEVDLDPQEVGEKLLEGLDMDLIHHEFVTTDEDRDLLLLVFEKKHELDKSSSILVIQADTFNDYTEVKIITESVSGLGFNLRFLKNSSVVEKITAILSDDGVQNEQEFDLEDE